MVMDVRTAACDVQSSVTDAVHLVHLGGLEGTYPIVNECTDFKVPI